MVATAREIIKPISRFQRAIHLRYDLRDRNALEQYIPTQSASDALRTIILNTEPQAVQRSHVLYAAYGSGKSHFAVVLASLLENAPSTRNEVERISDKFAEVDAQNKLVLPPYFQAERRLLPVVLSGNEGKFAPSMLRALNRALKDLSIQVELETRFKAALSTIERWKEDYPEFLTRLEEHLQDSAVQTIDDLVVALEKEQDDAYSVFRTAYTRLTAGATFDPLIEQTPEVIYRDVASQLQSHGYSGIVVIWDEFGRYLEGYASQAFGAEAAALQNFAETCNYSGEHQIHLLLFTHKELQGYANSLPQTYQQEWSRIEGRFQRHNLSTDPLVAYRLISNAIEHTDPAVVNHYLPDELVEWFIGWAQDYRLFGFLSAQETHNLINSTWPLHPLAVYALASISSRVAQNERTMFTFLTSDEPNALRSRLEQKISNQEDSLFLQVADLWDYFEDAIRADIGGSGTHRYWLGVVNALDKVAEGDQLSKELVKALGVISICSDNSFVRPSTELLGWAVGSTTDENQQAVVHALDNLRRRKVIIHRQTDGYWTFLAGSDINFEELLQVTLERINPTPVQLRRLLEQLIPAPYVVARRYNQQHAMSRYFSGVYRWADELEDAPWELLIDQEKSDGLVIYALITDSLEWEKAYKAIQANEQAVYVFPKEGEALISLRDALREVFALQEINNDASLREHADRDRIQREIDWLLSDAEDRLQAVVNELIDPRLAKSVWITIQEKRMYGYHVHSPGQTTKIISDICSRVFSSTPIFNLEGLNRHNPTSQQSRAAELVIDALFSRDPDETFGIEGRGPEVLALNALLKLPGILRKEQDVWQFGRPLDESPVTEIWDIINQYLDACVGKKQSLASLLEQLTAPPYGLRTGILSVLLAAVLRDRLMVATLYHGRSPLGMISGKEMSQAIEKPDDYSLEIGHWSPVFNLLWQAIISRFDTYIQDSESDAQPLHKIRVAMTRWLQGLPSFCRFTRHLSKPALQFRDVVRQVQTEPSKAVFATLPALLELDESSDYETISSRIDRLMHEVSNAFYDLQRRLDAFAANEFGFSGLTQDGLITLKSWLSSVETSISKPITEFRFSSTKSQNFVNVLVETRENDSMFWNYVSEAILGVSLRDWNDNSEARFYDELSKARQEIERDVHDLIEEDKAVVFAIQMPDDDLREFRFRSSDLSQQGQRLLQNFKSTMDIAGRPLSTDERRKIALAFLVHIMGEELD